MKNLEDVNILFVDDDQNVLNGLQRFLRKEKYNTFFASSGQDALDLIRRRFFEVVVMDIRMPKMTGIELAAKVKELHPDTIRMFLSATRDIENTIESINRCEVYRFIPKPLEPAAFKRSILDAIETYLLKTERQELLTELSARNRQLEKAYDDLEQTRIAKEELDKKSQQMQSRIEQLLLQTSAPALLQGASCSQITLPSGYLDGDFSEFVVYDNNKFDLLIGDVMGKGSQAALVAAGVKSRFLKIIAEKSYQGSRFRLSELSDILSQVHACSIEELTGLQMFITLNLARFDLQQKHMAFIDCGHPKILQFHAASGGVEYLEGTDLPFGVDPAPEFFVRTVDFLPGDVFCFYSDGVTEAENREGEQYDTRRLAEVIKGFHHLDPDGLVDRVRSEVLQFIDAEQFDDDFSCIIIRVDGEHAQSVKL